MTNKNSSRLINHVLRHFPIYWVVILLALAITYILLVQPARASLISEQGSSKTCIHDCTVDSLGYNLIRQFEGYYPFVYKDVGGIPTIGFGHVLIKGENFDQPLMGPDAESLLERDVSSRQSQINRLLKTPLSNRQYDAISSFSYNLGTTTFAKSSLLRQINAGNLQGAVPVFTRYDHVGNTISRGLFLRRRAEAALFASDIQPN